MASKTVNTILNLKDNFSKTIDKTTKNTKQFKKQMKLAEYQANQMKKKVTGAYKGILGTAAKVGVGIALATGVKDIVAAASKSESKLAQLDAVLTSTGGAAGISKEELLKLAEAQAKVTTYSKGTNIEAENMLLTFTGISKDVFPATLQATNDMATAMKTDTVSAAKQLGKALNDPATGLSKLTKVGVNFSEEQKKQIKAMVKAGDVTGAQTLMLQELQKEFGGSAEAAGKTFAGQLTILQNQINSVNSQIGAALLPYLLKFVQMINNNMPKIKSTIKAVLDLVLPKFKEWGGIISDIATTFFPDLGTSSASAGKEIKDLANKALTKITELLKWIRDNAGAIKLAIETMGAAWIAYKGILLILNIQQAITNLLLAAGAIKSGALTVAIYALYAADLVYAVGTKIATAAQWLFNAAMAANPISLVIIALATLGVAIYEVVTHWKDIVKWVKKAWKWLTKWNDTPAKDKNAKVTTRTETLGDVPTKKHNALGTSYWRGGLTSVNERGGEIIDLPNGSRVIPADKSKRMINSGKSNDFTININGVGKSTNEIINELVPAIKLAMANI